MIDPIVDKICKALNKHDTAIFCGAGISFHSGLPLVSDLTTKILSAIDISGDYASILLNSSLPFEAFIEMIRNEVNVDEILEIFELGEPNSNHEMIAELSKAGLIKNILTTNFDQLIEKALTIKGLQKETHFEVFSSEEDFGNINWKNDKIKVIKVHGCISNKNEMAITLDAVARKTTSQNKSRVITNFFSKSINPKVVVMGYSCSDVFDISPQIELIDQTKSEIFFIDHIASTSDCAIEDISLKSYKNPFRTFSGSRIDINTDLFVRTVWEVLITRLYQFKTNSISWSKNVDNWLRKAIETNSVGIKHHIPARLYYNIGEYEHSIKHCERGIGVAQSTGNQITFYSELGNLGMALNALGRYSDARKCLEESVNACRDIGNIQGEISQSQALGNIYRNLREFDSAIKVYTRAISLAEKEKDSDGLCTALGNLATVYNQTGQAQEAINCLEKGLSIARHIGNKQSEGSMLCSIGISYFQMGNTDKAAQFIQKSINATRLLGDKQGECMAQLNLSNVHLQLENFDECITNATSSLQIARVIGIRQSEAGAYYNIGSAYFFKGDSKEAIPYLKKAKEIYLEIYGDKHSHTQAAIKALIHAEEYVKQF